MERELANRGLRARGKELPAIGYARQPQQISLAPEAFSLSRGLYATDRLVNESLNDRIPPPRAAVFGPTAMASIQLPGLGRSHPSKVDLAALAGDVLAAPPSMAPCPDSAEPVGGFHDWADPHPRSISLGGVSVIH